MWTLGACISVPSTGAEFLTSSISTAVTFQVWGRITGAKASRVRTEGDCSLFEYTSWEPGFTMFLNEGMPDARLYLHTHSQEMSRPTIHRCQNYCAVTELCKERSNREKSNMSLQGHFCVFFPPFFGCCCCWGTICLSSAAQAELL